MPNTYDLVEEEAERLFHYSSYYSIKDTIVRTLWREFDQVQN